MAWVGYFVIPLYTATGQDLPSIPETGVFRDTLDLSEPQPFILQPFILPGSESLQFGETRLDSTSYRLDYRHGRLWLKKPVPDGSLLVVEYRVLPFRYTEPFRLHSIVRTSPDAPDTTTASPKPRQATTAAGEDDLFGSTRLQRSGSITRGIIAGNNRDLSVESGLRMQLAGEVTEGVRLQAVLTDENTPIQPEGTTQRLSEFDRVSIQLQSPYGTAQLGDFDLALTGTEFARFNRKLQGVSVSTRYPDPPNRLFGGGNLVLSGAASRGIYRSQQIEPIDGVQGPYRLEGNEGEQFIVVIAGSETVYLDGRRMTRGETNDYVVDYQTGEITFTPRRLITEDRRILVEFQYTTSEFTRTIVGSQIETNLWQRSDGTARAVVGGTFLREADGRSFNAELGLTSLDSLLLVEAGDGPAIRSGAERVVFDAEAPYVQYARELRPGVGGTMDTIYVALSSRPADSVDVFRVRFTRVGAGRGRYVRAGRAVNGILYEYRGEGMGEYEPVRVIPKPRSKQLVDLHGGIEPVRGFRLFGEWAQSIHDQNRLSDLDSGDDLGWAYTAGLEVTPQDARFATISGSIRRRFVDSRFEPFDRIRPVEFERQWNLPTRSGAPSGIDLLSEQEVTDEGSILFTFSPASSLQGEIGRIDLGRTFAADRQAATLQIHELRYPQLDYRFEYVSSRDSLFDERGNWLRQLGTLQYALLNGRLVPHLEVEQERRLVKPTLTDSLTSTSFVFVEYRPGLTWVTDRFEAGGEIEYRTEEAAAGGMLRPSSTSWTLQSRWVLRNVRAFTTNADIGYRIRSFDDYFRIQEGREDNESVIIQWNSRYTPFQRAIEASWFYEALTERTPLLQEIYVRTGPEYTEAQYVWEDANNDGIIQVDEFIPERTPNEGQYARTYLPSDTLTSVIGVQARFRIVLDPDRVWRNSATAWKRTFSKVTSRTTFEVVEKSREQDLAQIYLLNLNRFMSSVNTLNGRIRIGQELQFFRNEPRYGLDLAFNQLRNLSELSAGEEQRFLNSWSLVGRYKPIPAFGIKLTASTERNRVLSESFSSRRYDIEALNLEPELSYSPDRSVQLLSGLSASWKRDYVGNRRATLLKIPVEARYSVLQKLQSSARVELAQISLEGDAVGLARYELTDGRGPGRSLLWTVQGQYSLNAYLRASLSYDGRVPSGAPAIHTLRMQLSAVF
jgi:hypothetical protein